jgi:hypothetical protein
LIDNPRWHHHPNGARLFQLMCELFKRRGPDGTLFRECLYGFRMDVVNDTLVSGPTKPSHHIGPHPA